MPTARFGAGAAVLDDKLWVAGGFDGRSRVASVEVFDPVSNTWDRTKSNMTSERRSHTLAVLGGELYAVGGHGRQGPGSVEKYDPRDDSWSIVPEMALPRFANNCAGALLR